MGRKGYKLMEIVTKRTVEVFHDSESQVGSQTGRYRAQLQKNPGIVGVGKTSQEALFWFLIDASSRGLSGKEENYTVVLNFR